MPTSNHNKITDLLVAAIVLVIPLSIIGVNVSNASKSALKPSIMKCEELKTGDRGYIRGIISERKKDEWTNLQVATLAESNSCQTLVKFSENGELAGLIRPGAKLKMAVEVESDYSSILINDDVSEDYTIIDLDGTMAPTQTRTARLGKSLVPTNGKSLELTYEYGLGNTYFFSKEVARKLEPNIKMKWYFHAREKRSKYFIVSDVKKVN